MVVVPVAVPAATSAAEDRASAATTPRIVSRFKVSSFMSCLLWQPGALLADVCVRRLAIAELPLQWRCAGLDRVGFPDHVGDALVAVGVRVAAHALCGL